MGKREGRKGEKILPVIQTYLAANRSYNVVESTRSTTTRSIHLAGKRSHACQSMMQPPARASGSMASRSYK